MDLFKIDVAGAIASYNGLSATPTFSALLRVKDQQGEWDILLTDKNYAQQSANRADIIAKLVKEGTSTVDAGIIVDGWLSARSKPLYASLSFDYTDLTPVLSLSRAIAAAVSGDVSIQRINDFLNATTNYQTAVSRMADFVQFTRAIGYPTDRAGMQKAYSNYFTNRGCPSYRVKLVPANEGAYTTAAQLFATEGDLGSNSTNGNWSHVLDGGMNHWGTSLTMLYLTMDQDGFAIAIPNSWFGYNITAISSGSTYGNPTFFTAVNNILVNKVATSAGWICFSTTSGDQSPMRWWGTTILSLYYSVKNTAFNTANQLYCLGAPASFDYAMIKFGGVEVLSSVPIRINGVSTSVPCFRISPLAMSESYSISRMIVGKSEELGSEFNEFLTNYPYATGTRMSMSSPFVNVAEEVLKQTELYKKAQRADTDIYETEIASGITFKTADNKAKKKEGSCVAYGLLSGLKAGSDADVITADAAKYGTWAATATYTLTGVYGASTFVLTADSDYSAFVHILRVGTVNCGAFSQSTYLATLLAVRGEPTEEFVDVSSYELRLDNLVPFGYCSNARLNADIRSRVALVTYGTVTTDMISLIGAARSMWHLHGLKKAS